jgi:hypothetical protein
MLKVLIICFKSYKITQNLLFVYDQCTDHPRDPSTEGEQEDDKDRAAAFVNDGKRRADDADNYTEAAHGYLRST